MTVLINKEVEVVFQLTRKILRILSPCVMLYSCKDIFLALREGLKFLCGNDERSIDNGFTLQYVLAYPVYRNTKLLLKANSTLSLHDTQACSDNCLLITTDHGTKQENFLQMWRRSPQRLFVSVLYFVVVDCCDVLENGIDKQENRDQRTANCKSGKPRPD